MDIRKFDESKFLKSEHLEPGKDYPKIIESVTAELVTGDRGGDKEMAVLWFRGEKRGFGLGAKINREMVVYNLGSHETDDWLGRKLVLYRTMTEMKGKPVPCIRIRPKDEVLGTDDTLSVEANPKADDIPF